MPTMPLSEKLLPVEEKPLFRESAKDRRVALSIQTLLITETNSTALQFLRYSFVGGIAFVMDFGTLFSLTHFLGIHYLISAAAAFIIGLLINYAISSSWVFARRTIENRALEFTIFAAVGIAGLGLNELGMWLLAGLAALNYLWAKIITACIVYVWNFGARKAALFR